MNPDNKAAYEEKLALAALLEEHVGSQDDALRKAFHFLVNIGKCSMCLDDMGKEGDRS